MSTDFRDSKEWALTLNLLEIIPYVVKGIPEAIDLYKTTIASLKSGVSDEQMQTTLAERDSLIETILAAK